MGRVITSGFRLGRTAAIVVRRACRRQFDRHYLVSEDVHTVVGECRDSRFFPAFTRGLLLEYLELAKTAGPTVALRAFRQRIHRHS